MDPHSKVGGRGSFANCGGFGADLANTGSLLVLEGLPMRDFLLGVAAITLFGFLVLWTLTPTARAPGEMADAKKSAPAPVATSPPAPPPASPPPPVKERAPAPAEPSPTLTPAEPATVATEAPETPAPVAERPVSAPAASVTPTRATPAAGMSVSPSRGKKIRQGMKPARPVAAKPPAPRPAQKVTQARPASRGKKPKGQ
jgi:hypothetical protein